VRSCAPFECEREEEEEEGMMDEEDDETDETPVVCFEPWRACEREAGCLCERPSETTASREEEKAEREEAEDDDDDVEAAGPRTLFCA
jgi:hypothetical protein